MNSSLGDIIADLGFVCSDAESEGYQRFSISVGCGFGRSRVQYYDYTSQMSTVMELELEVCIFC
jgi:hypothetical protein